MHIWLVLRLQRMVHPWIIPASTLCSCFEHYLWLVLCKVLAAGVLMLLQKVASILGIYFSSTFLNSRECHQVLRLVLEIKMGTFQSHLGLRPSTNCVTVTHVFEGLVVLLELFVSFNSVTLLQCCMVFSLLKIVLNSFTDQAHLTDFAHLAASC